MAQKVPAESQFFLLSPFRWQPPWICIVIVVFLILTLIFWFLSFFHLVAFWKYKTSCSRCEYVLSPADQMNQLILVWTSKLELLTKAKAGSTIPALTLFSGGRIWTYQKSSSKINMPAINCPEIKRLTRRRQVCCAFDPLTLWHTSSITRAKKCINNIIISFDFTLWYTN